MWLDGALYFCTGPGEQRALNLRANNQCALTMGDNRWKAGLDSSSKEKPNGSPMNRCCTR